MRQSLAEYLRELFGGYRSVVAGVVLEVLGILAIFWSNQRALHIIGVVGVAAGFVVAPFLAFHRMRLQRDAVATGGTLFLRGPRPANELSFGNWSLDSFASPNEDGIAARAMVAAHHLVAATTQFSSALADSVKETLENSAVEGFLSSLTGSSGAWQLISPTNDWVITAIRDPVPLGRGWEVWARCMVELPRSFGGRWPFAVADACFRPIRSEPVPDAQFNAALSPKPAGPARLNLLQIRDLLSNLATTVVHDVAPVAFRPVIERTRRERFLACWRKHEGLRLIGPNFDVRSRPHMLIDVLEMPQLTRRAGAPNDNRLYAETPSRVDSYDARQRDHVIAEGILRCLRQHEYADAESFADELTSRVARA